MGFNSLALAEQEKISALNVLPKDAYHGLDKFSLKQKMKQAMVEFVGEKNIEVIAVSIPDNWEKRVYTKQISRQNYRKITGIILWRDTHNDQFCRYTGYHFIQEMLEGKWSALRLYEVCNECVEGEVECFE